MHIEEVLQGGMILQEINLNIVAQTTCENRNHFTLIFTEIVCMRASSIQMLNTWYSSVPLYMSFYCRIVIRILHMHDFYTIAKEEEK